jgi:hypothetical protein
MSHVMSALYPLRFLAVCLGAAVLVGLSACTDPTDFKSNHEIVRLPPLGATSGPEPMLRLDSRQLPDSPIVADQIKASYYSCAGVVGAWFLELIVAEMNFLARHHELDRLDGSACSISVSKAGMDSGRIKLHLYASATEANDCVFKNKCSLARNVTLVPTTKAVLRSYFLSDLKGEKFYQHCLSPHLWHQGVSCEYIGLEAALGATK